MIEQDPLVPVDLRSRLEVARLQNLAVMRTLDRGFPTGTPIPRADVLSLGQLDADCAEALWALDQSQRSLDVRSMVQDTLSSLARLPAVRQRLRDLFLEYPHDMEKEILCGLDPAEAYSQVPGRAARAHPSRRAEQPLVGRNALCPCGSGRKYKKCCLLSPTAVRPTAETAPPPNIPKPRYHFQPGSYGGKGRFVPSIACERELADGQRALHFVLVRPQAVRDDQDDATAAAETDLAAAFIDDHRNLVIPEQVALHLRSVGYLVVEDPRLARD